MIRRKSFEPTSTHSVPTCRSEPTRNTVSDVVPRRRYITGLRKLKSGKNRVAGRRPSALVASFAGGTAPSSRFRASALTGGAAKLPASSLTWNS